MKKSIMLSFLIMLLLLIGCSNEEGQSKAENNDKLSIKLGTTGPEDGHPFPEASNKFKEIIEEKSDGSIEVEVFPNSQLGGERELIEGIETGTVDMSVVTSDGALPNWVNENQIFTIPYLIDDRETMHDLLDNELGEFLTEEVEKEGMKNLGFWDLGMRSTTNDVRPIEKPGDFKDLKIRVMESSVWLSFMEEVGASATPMAIDEVYSALEQNVVDGQINPPLTILSNSFNEVQQYLTIDNQSLAPGNVIFNKQLWDDLSEDQQKLIQESVDEATEYSREWVEKEEEDAINELEEKGMEVTEVDSEKFKQETEGVGEDILNALPDKVREKLEN